MFIRQNKMLLLWILLVVSSFNGSSSNTVVTYTTKNAEEMQCLISGDTLTATWSDATTTADTLYTYRSNSPDIDILKTEPKHENFNYSYVPSTHFNLIIDNVEREDGGTYSCVEISEGTFETVCHVTVEVLAKPTVQYELQDVDVLNVTVGTSYELTCSATEARSVSDLSLVWDPSLVVKTHLDIKPNGDDYKDYSITSTYEAVRGITSITCQLTGYVMQDEINDQRIESISHTVNLNVRYAPICNMTLKEVGDCRNVTLTCKCDAVPADITQYSFFDGTREIYDEANNTFTLSVAYGTESSFSCSATNSIGPGDQTDPTVHNCNEATESTTEKSESTTTKKSGPRRLTPGAITGIIVGVLAVVIVIVVIAVIMYKTGKCGSNSSSDKLDDNGAGPAVVTEPPTYGKIDKNRTKDPTPAPRSSMRDSKNPSNPKQDGPMEMQYADLDHGNKPPSDEVRKPKEEPTEYATVQSVIV